MDEVNDFVKSLVMEEEFDPSNTDTSNLMGHNKGCTPMYMNHTAVKYFIDIMKANGTVFDVVDSGWGKFVLIPDEHLPTYFTVRDGLVSTNLTYICPPVLYFIALKGINYNIFSENVIELQPESIEQYKQWLEEMMESFRSN
jgi:phosphosulfolactate synthase (CoM biosynthesis protein A)